MKPNSSSLILGKKRHSSFQEINKYNLNPYLPVCSYAEEINNIINTNQVSIISGKTGCGKTTQIPQLIFNSSLSKNKPVNILITQPRRLAAISIATRLSKELKSQLGNLVGFHVGLNSLFSKAKTKIIVKTTGLFLEEIIHEKDNLNYTHIILDEVHERDINIDFLLILIKKYITNNPKVKIILMSATISTQLFQDFFSNKDNNEPKAPIFEIKENIFNITRVYIDEIIQRLSNDGKENSFVTMSRSFDISNPFIDEEVYHLGAHLIKYLHLENKDKLTKGILVFLPGFGEIQSFSYIVMQVIDYLIEDVELLILHSNISDEEQEKIFEKNDKKRKIILSTNIAESSITIDNNDFIIDFCLVKELQYDHLNHKESLELKWASQANCEQRAGRTGRVGPGVVFRLITKKFYEKLSSYPSPELLRVSLEKLILKIKVYDCGEPDEILKEAIQPPECSIISTTIQHLQNSGALTVTDNSLTSSGELTPLGKIYAELPIDIRYSRLIMLSFCFGMAEPGIVIASILSQEKKLFKSGNTISRIDQFDAKKHFSLNSNCDMITSYMAYKAWEKAFGMYMLSHEHGRKKRRIESSIIKQEFEWCKAHVLNSKTLKETLVLVADLKKRMINLGIYQQRLNTNGEVIINIVDFTDLNNQMLFKYLLAGAFYNNMLSASYIHEKKVKRETNDLLNKNNNNNSFALEKKTITYKQLNNDYDTTSFNKKLKTSLNETYVESLSKIIDSSTIDEVKINYNEMRIGFNQYDSIKKILFVSSYKQLSINKNNDISISNSLILKRPEYVYELNLFDLFTISKIDINPSSINYITIEPEPSELDLNIAICDNYIEHNLRKVAMNTSLLPKQPGISLILLLLFSPYVVFYSNEKQTQYASFQISGFTSLFKFKHLFSGFDIKFINSIRSLLNQQVKVNLKSSSIENEDDKDKYNKRTEQLKKELFALANKPRIKMIMKEDYIRLFELLYPEKYSQTELNYKETDDKSKNMFLQNEQMKNDFLPLLKPLTIKEDFRMWTNEGMESIKAERQLFTNMKDDFKQILSKRLEIIHQFKPQLCCGMCKSYICSVSSITIIDNINTKLPLFKIDGWMTSVVKEIQNGNVLLENNSFVLRHSETSLTPDVFLACGEGTHVIGVKYKNNYYVQAFSNLVVKFPMQNYIVWDNHLWKNNFEGIDKEMIIQQKARVKFIEENLKCELCYFSTKKENEFSKHLKEQAHICNVNDLENEQF